MVANKHITKIITAVMAAAVVLCFLAVAFSQKLSDTLGGMNVSMEYENELFNTDEVISIDIKMNEEDWDEMLKNATSEEYYSCDVVINGTTIYNVGIRPKGNTSLSSIANDPDTDRFSFKLEFGHFVAGQTCYGLDKLILNNNYADATNMKETIIYDMFQYIGAEASLYNYATISLNGDYKGVYLALEGVENSFMLRNFGTQDGELYKPDSMEIGGGKSSSSSSQGGMQPPPGGFEGMTPPSGDFEGMTPPESGFSGGGLSMSGKGADLDYSDDDLDSYTTIWEGALTDSSDADHRRVVKALKNISKGKDLEEYLDVDNILKYMAVHTFAVNEDSLSGTMAHNYYLYEYEGKLNIFPWDYNLSFGGMGMGGSNATEMINDAIDTPFSGTEFFDALLENEEYLKRYHEYLRQLTEEYVDGGRFDEVYNRIRNRIDDLVKTDPTAFYTYDEYTAAADMLYNTILLRAESIEGQLDGTIPSTDSEQKADSSAFIDGSAINTSAMGSFNMGGVEKGNEGKRRGGRARGDKNSNRPPNRGAGQAISIVNTTGLITYGVCLAVMLAALLVFRGYKRRRA